MLGEAEDMYTLTETRNVDAAAPQSEERRRVLLVEILYPGFNAYREARIGSQR